MQQCKTYYDVKSSTKRIQVHQGGTRSGKSWSILQALIEWCVENPNSGWIITVVRKTFPSLRGSILRDFIEILNKENYYQEKYHNKSDQIYNLFGTTWEFISVDQSQKVRGRRRQICFCNEANELFLEDFRQLSLRTTEKIILDYNPSDEYHWIYDEVLTRDDCEFHRTTYKDNPFLSQDLIREIERLKDVDEDYWRVYGLGLRGQSKETIFNASTYKELPEHSKLLAYGLDFGFVNDPTALVKVHLHGEDLYVEEMIYETRLTNQDIGERMKLLNIPRHVEIIADSAEMKSIEELHRMGFNVKPAKKGPDSVRIGIDLMKRRRIFIKEDSIETQKEFRNYKWMTDKNGKVLNKPVDLFNHSVDATRYCCLNKLLKKTGTYHFR